MSVKFVDLKAQYAQIQDEINAAVLNVLGSTQYVLGPEVAAFEREFAAYCEARHAIAVNTGTSALHLALLAADIGPGDEVISVPFTFVATVAAILYAGATPIFVDIDPATFTMDVRVLDAAITPRTRAIMPVHLYGQPADMEPILALAKARGLLVIEDAAQAHGARYKGARCGSLGDMAGFSFYPGKNLGAYGEGGAVTTNNDEYARRIRMLRDWGAQQRYCHELKGYNYRMDGIQGAILRVKLRYLDAWTAARRDHAALYDRLLSSANPRLTPYARPDSEHVYHIYAIRSADRDGLQAALAKEDIATGIHYPTPVHLQPAYADLGYGRGDFPESERAAAEVLSLPMYAELSDADIETVSRAVLAYGSGSGDGSGDSNGK